jgi:hypothetical protein
MFKAYVQQSLDPLAKKDDAKKAYENYLAVLLAGDQTKLQNNIIGCYQYLSSYYSTKYYMEPGSPNVKEYKKLSLDNIQKILAIDPKNKYAKEAYDSWQKK